MFISLARDQAAVIRNKLLETLALEADRAVRNKISDAVAEIARQYADNSQFLPITVPASTESTLPVVRLWCADGGGQREMRVGACRALREGGEDARSSRNRVTWPLT